MVKTHGGPTADEDMKPPLHNFDLPCLKWGNQKLLRCMKVDSTGDRNHSLESTTPPPRRFRFRSSDGDRRYKFPATIGTAGDGEIEATREKLMFDFQKEVVKMKDAILRDRVALPPPPPATTASTSNPPPWNLRTRRAALTASNGVNINGEVLKPNSSSYSPAVNDFKSSKLRPANDVVNATEIPKLSVSLSRRELEEDFMAMAGRRLPRKPKKRPRIVQRQLDTLFPGLWLSEITADLYKVPDEAESTGKR